MLVFEIRSLSCDNFDEDILSEIVESDDIKTAYKYALSTARKYANEYNCYASVIAHNKDNYNATSFNCFYVAPYHTKRFANAHRDANGFFTSNWRAGY